MRAFWSETRANGNPIEAGTFCRVIDLEDGTNPIYVYGKTQEEVYEKIERQNANAQLALARRPAAPAQPGSTRSTPPAVRQVSADQVMQATADLQNPAKAGAAIATLLESATGLDPVEQARRAYATLALEWENETEAFYEHPGNRQLIGGRAIRMAGGKPGLVTKQILNSAFQELQAEGLLFERPEDSQHNQNGTTLNDVSRPAPGSASERPRGTLFATGARSTTFSAPQTAQTRALKYTEEQIRTMPDQERLRVFNDPDYIKACDFYYSQGQRATA